MDVKMDRTMRTVSERRWRLYHSAGNSTSVEVYLREVGAGSDLTLSNRLTLKGPFCEQSQMLPASFSLRPIEQSLWHATILDPCYWTPSLPARYRLEVESEANGPSGSPVEFPLRRLHVRGANLILDGRRWVFRGTRAAGILPKDMAALQELRLGLVVDPSELSLAPAASRLGVPIMVRLGESRWQDALIEAAPWPAFQLGLVPANWGVSREELAELTPNVLWVADLTRDGVGTLPVWADAVLCSAESARLAAVVASGPARPILVARAGALQCSGLPAPELAEVRRSSERLQKQFISTIDASGYVV